MLFQHGVILILKLCSNWDFPSVHNPKPLRGYLHCLSVLLVLGMAQGDSAVLLVSKQPRMFRDVMAAFEILGKLLHDYL